VNNLYFKIIRLLAKNEYELKARYLPALIFTLIFEIAIVSKYYPILGLGLIDLLKTPLVIFSALFIALVPKFCATTISGYIQTLYWDIFGNTIIKYIQKSKNKVYRNILEIFDCEDKLISDMLKITREDKLLFSKNIFYGFMRNFSFLIFIFFMINLYYFNYFIIENLLVLIFSFVCLYISSQRYAEQIIKSYLELRKEVVK
jgi:hypothetical protein